jgi:hypothetical protein
MVTRLRAAKTTAKRKIARLISEIESIDAFFYGETGDIDTDLWILERKRDDRVRALVLQLHTSTDDLLNIRIANQILRLRQHGSRTIGRKSKSARALRKLLVGGGSIGFERKLDLAVAIGLMGDKAQKRFEELNRLRNKCSYNWLLKVPVRRGKKPKEKKPPLLIYKGRDLHQAGVLEEFGSEYIHLHMKLFLQD